MRRGRRGKPIPEEIQALGRRVARWRRTRAKRSPMPESLWREATRLASVHGVSPVCRHVGLSYASLQKRVDATGGDRRPEAACGGGFVEVSAAQLLGAPVVPQTVLELSDGQGRRLTLRLAPGQEVDVRELVESFRGRGR